MKKNPELNDLKIYVLAVEHGDGANTELKVYSSVPNVLTFVGSMPQDKRIRNIYMADGEGNTLPLEIAFLNGKLQVCTKGNQMIIN